MDNKSSSPTVTTKLRGLLRDLDGGLIDPEALREGLSLALLALSDAESVHSSDDSVISSVSNSQVRAWLATTFTRQETCPSRPRSPKDRFRAVANAIIIGKYFENIVRDTGVCSEPSVPCKVVTILQKHLDCWEFPIFTVESLAKGHTLRYLGYELFRRHDLFDRCNISPLVFDTFLSRIQADYGCHGNPYHNATHGADVAQTMHYFIQHSSIKPHLTHLDTLSLLLAALIHDVHHPGTSNAFQITQNSDYALMYNDRSVLENHHLHHTFTLLREKQCDILSGLSADEFKIVRGMVIDMVLATDMSTHFQQLKSTRLTLSHPNSGSQLMGSDRSKSFSFILHLADISHPGKKWEEHWVWSDRLCNEFFRQGDRERTLGFPLSPLCDRDNTNLPDSQLGFIECIVAPCFEVCGSMFEAIAELPLPPNTKSHDVSHDHIGPWIEHMSSNKVMWIKQKGGQLEDVNQSDSSLKGCSSNSETVS